MAGPLYSLTVLGALVGLVSSADLASYVNPLVGSQNGGNTFPGVTVPYGMVKLGPDMDTGLSGGPSVYSGYLPGATFFNAFSMLHESGTGGAPKYGVVSQMPVLGGPVTNPLSRHADQRGSAADEASPGSYKTTMASGIIVELAASSRAGLYQYTFPHNSTTPANNSVIVDVSHFLPAPDRAALSQHYLGGNITVSSYSEDGGGLHYEGSGTYNNGWNLAPAWTVYFCGYFDSPGTVQTFLGTDNTGGVLNKYPAGDTVPYSTSRLGAVFTFNSSNTVVTSRVGVSFISAGQACQNVDQQVPFGANQTTLAAQTRSVWNDEVLSTITTTDTANTTRLQLLYTSLYHMLLLPQNKTGENPLWASSEPYYDDIFTLWDLFRCSTALWHVLQPAMYEEFLRSLVDVWRHAGFLPDARSSFFSGATQGGSNADNVLADAYVKGVRGAVDWADAYAAMKTDAETVPPNTNKDPRDPTGSTQEGRGALPDWLAYGFITHANFGRSVSRAVEYSVNDFSLYQVASGLGEASDAGKYLQRSRNWRNHWNPSATSLNFSGFVVPRTKAAFIQQDPLLCGGCYWADDYYEALPWEYSFNAHHDIDTLINYSGGGDTFVRRLETMFIPGLRPHGSEPFNNTIFNPGNEPSFTTPYLFNFVGRQDLSVKYSRAAADAYYAPTPGGLPGNSDAGAMESWLLWSMLGLYPVTGQTTFLVGSPWFANLTISLGGGKALQITAANASSSGSIYVQSLKVNGRPWSNAWVTYDDIFASGGTLDFVLGPEPANWTAGGVPPPSPATENNGTGGGIPPPLNLPTVARARWAVVEPVLVSLLSTAGASLLGLTLYLYLRHRWAKKHRPQEAAAAEEGSAAAAAAAHGRVPASTVTITTHGQSAIGRRFAGLHARLRRGLLRLLRAKVPSVRAKAAPTAVAVVAAAGTKTADGSSSESDEDAKGSAKQGGGDKVVVTTTEVASVPSPALLGAQREQPDGAEAV